jgi:transcriptional regulator
MNVPTWSYTAVHVKCTASLVSDEKLAAVLMKKLVAHYEGKNKTNWDYNLPQDFHDGLMKAIVWIKFKVNNLEGKFKLSQNRDQTDYDSLRAQLMKDESDNTKGLLKYMNLTNPHT